MLPLVVGLFGEQNEKLKKKRRHRLFFLPTRLYAGGGHHRPARTQEEDISAKVGRAKRGQRARPWKHWWISSLGATKEDAARRRRRRAARRRLRARSTWRPGACGRGWTARAAMAGGVEKAEVRVACRLQRRRRARVQMR